MDSLPIEVTLFGAFAIQHVKDGKTYRLSEKDSTSKRLMAFLQYLMVFHQRGVGQDELIEALWGDSDSANPANTLKTLLHRGRAALEQLGFSDGKEVLLYRRGVYAWNPNLNIILDTERFEQLEQKADNGDLDAAKEAIALYTGDFLPNAIGTPWVVSIRTFYHSQYLHLCAQAASMLLNGKQYEEAARICQQATTVDPYDETSHLLLMQAMVAAGNHHAAMQHYAEVTNMFMDQLGVNPSDEMSRYYRELMKADQDIEMDLGVIRENLLERRPGGAFFCEYGVFQDIYRLEARSAVRSGRVVQMVMMTVLGQDDKYLPAKQAATAMEMLRSVIQKSLRTGDTFTRFSPVQYLILLPTASYENGVMVVERVLQEYRATLMGKTSVVKYSILPVLPAVESEKEAPHFYK